LQLISFGFTGIVAIFGIGLDSLTSNKSLPQIDDFFLFCILIPLACFLVLFLWENSMHKTLLIGHYIAKEIEPKVAILLRYLQQVTDSHIPHIIFPISWENYMRTQNVGLEKKQSLLLIFGGIGSISWLIGMIIIIRLRIWFLVILGILSLFIFIRVGQNLYSKLKTLYDFRDKIPNTPEKSNNNPKLNVIQSVLKTIKELKLLLTNQVEKPPTQENLENKLKQKDEVLIKEVSNLLTRYEQSEKDLGDWENKALLTKSDWYRNRPLNSLIFFRSPSRVKHPLRLPPNLRVQEKEQRAIPFLSAFGEFPSYQG
jgi:hypothetical protein